MIQEGDARMDKPTTTDGGKPQLEKTWYIYLNDAHGVVTVVDHPIWPAGTTPQVSRTPGPPCGNAVLPHCSFRVVKSRFDDIDGPHRSELWPRYDGSGDCLLSVREDPAVD